MNNNCVGFIGELFWEIKKTTGLTPFIYLYSFVTEENGEYLKHSIKENKKEYQKHFSKWINCISRSQVNDSVYIPKIKVNKIFGLNKSVSITDEYSGIKAEVFIRISEDAKGNVKDLGSTVDVDISDADIYILEEDYQKNIELLIDKLNDKKLAETVKQKNENNDYYFIIDTKKYFKRLDLIGQREYLRKAFKKELSEYDQILDKDSYHATGMNSYLRFLTGIAAYPFGNKKSNIEEKQFDGFNTSICNEIRNLLIDISQGFVVVISGLPGSGKAALCDAIGSLTDGIYKSFETKRSWEEELDWVSEDLIDLFEETNDSDDDGLLVISLKKISKAPIEDYFDSFMDLNRRWYRNEIHGVTLNNKWVCIPDKCRFILEMDTNASSSIPDDLLCSASIFEVSDAEGLVADIQKQKEYLTTTFAKLFINLSPVFGDQIQSGEIWEGHSRDRETYKNVICLLQKNVLIDGYSFSVGPQRTEHAVSRYWTAAKNILDNEHIRKSESEEWKYYYEKHYIPEGVEIDDSLIPSGKESYFMIKKEIVAMDYAISQRVIPYITKTKGKVKIKNIAEIVEFLLENKLFHSAVLLKNAIDIGRVEIIDELTEESNEGYIIKKCEKVYSDILNGVDDSASLPEDILNRYCDFIHQFRDPDTYTRNVIANMLICLTQGFLTVFSGTPGCGKTSICRILGGTLGLWNFTTEDSETLYDGYQKFSDRKKNAVDPARFLEVSTERGWTSKRDFIGYYNPLTEQFDKANALLYNAFLIMNDEAKKKADNDLPYFILLDEANLSSMEYYWADFMNLCESWSENNSIDLGGGKVFKIPEGLHFMATINNDHTTEILSPRLIDRARAT